MPSAVDNYAAAKAELVKIDGEASLLAAIVIAAAKMFERGNPLAWRFGGAPRWDKISDTRMRVDADEELGTIDPTTWPTAQQFIQMRQRVKEASDKVAAAYAALSPDEKSFVQPQKSLR